MKTLLSTILIVLLLMSTSSGDGMIHRSSMSVPISSVEGPSFADRNEVVYLEVSFPESQGEFLFNENISGNTRKIELRTEYRVSNYPVRPSPSHWWDPNPRPPIRRICPPNYERPAHNYMRNSIRYRFSSSTAGTYYFKFKSYNGRYVTHILTVR